MRRNSSSSHNLNRKDKPKREEGSSTDQGKSLVKPNTSALRTGTSNIKCFKCLGRGHIACECPTIRTDRAHEGR